MGNVDVARTLLSSPGVDVHAANVEGRTALAVARGKGHAAVAALLVVAGARSHHDIERLNQIHEHQHARGACTLSHTPDCAIFQKSTTLDPGAYGFEKGCAWWSGWVAHGSVDGAAMRSY